MNLKERLLADPTFCEVCAEEVGWPVEIKVLGQSVFITGEKGMLETTVGECLANLEDVPQVH